jgi:hypothetical protein
MSKHTQWITKAAVAAIVGVAIASGVDGADAAKKYRHVTVPVAPNCQVNVATGGTGKTPGKRLPVDALNRIVDDGGRIMVERNAPWLYQLTVTGVVLHEDDPYWGDLRDYEVECR